MTKAYVIHGLKHSYFTGKLECYFRAKGLPYDFVDQDTADFQACAKATGVAQMPQLEMPDGSWMTDSTPIIAHFEDAIPAPRFRPADSATQFLSLLIEDFADEWLWRPALYYRWAFEEDAKLMGHALARTMLRDQPGPPWLRERFMRKRQQRVFLGGDGVTKETAPHVEALFHETLGILDGALKTRPFLFGDHPCEADFGMMGPFWRHFSADPTPLAIMREEGPHVLEWSARMWALTPERLTGSPATSCPPDLDPLLKLTEDEYLPYLAANEAARLAGEKTTTFQNRGANWVVPTAPYRAFCLSALRRAYGALTDSDKAAVNGRIGTSAPILAARDTFEGLDTSGPARDRLHTGPMETRRR